MSFFVVPGNDPVLIGMPHYEKLELLSVNFTIGANLKKGQDQQTIKTG